MYRHRGFRSGAILFPRNEPKCVKPLVNRELSHILIEKIEEYTDVSFAIVLYTGCDVGKLKTETDLKLRARQNVVFEHGYLVNKLGRKRVVALVISIMQSFIRHSKPARVQGNAA